MILFMLPVSLRIEEKIILSSYRILERIKQNITYYIKLYINVKNRKVILKFIRCRWPCVLFLVGFTEAPPRHIFKFL